MVLLGGRLRGTDWSICPFSLSLSLSIQFLVPGDTHNGNGSNGGNGSSSSSKGLRAFAWASTVTPPPPQGSDSREDPESTKYTSEGKDGEDPVDASADSGRGDGHPERRGGGREPWDVAVAVPPSKAMRDTVRFEGLRVLLFFVEEKDEEQHLQTGASDVETVLLRSVCVVYIPEPVWRRQQNQHS